MKMQPNNQQQPRPQQQNQPSVYPPQQQVHQQQPIYQQQVQQQTHHVPVQQYRQPMMGVNPNQQANVVYVSFNPSPNYRHISYIFLAISIVGSIVASVIFGGPEEGGETAVCMIYTACCFPLGIACILDAVFYHTKKTWHENTGSDSTGSTVGMIFDIIFAVFCFGMVILICSITMFG